MARGYKTKSGTNGSLHETRAIIVDQLKRSLRQNGRVCIERFGCFQLRKIASRKFKNNNGKISITPAYTKIHFSASLPFKKYINE